MKFTFLLTLVISLLFSSINIHAQPAGVDEKTTKTLIQCQAVLFALSLSDGSDIDQNAAIYERIRKVIPKITTKEVAIRLSKDVVLESQNLITQITSENLTKSRAQELKKEFTTLCTPLLLKAESIPDTCWKHTVIDTHGSNNVISLCASQSIATITVYYPNPGDTPTICRQSGIKTGKPDGTFSVLLERGNCDNGRTIQPTVLTCNSTDDQSLVCKYNEEIEPLKFYPKES